MSLSFSPCGNWTYFGNRCTAIPSHVSTTIAPTVDHPSPNSPNSSDNVQNSTFVASFQSYNDSFQCWLAIWNKLLVSECMVELHCTLLQMYFVTCVDLPSTNLHHTNNWSRLPTIECYVACTKLYGMISDVPVQPSVLLCIDSQYIIYSSTTGPYVTTILCMIACIIFS